MSCPQLPAIWRRFLLALPALLLFWASVFIFFQQSLARDGEFTYALDDSYIHLAIAKNLGFHGVWGTSPQEFASSSSSLLWTTLLAFCLRVGGNHSLFPLFLNLFFGSGCVLALNYLLQRGRISPLWTAIIAAILVFAAPMPTLAVEGLEHLLHILVTLIFLSLAADILSRKQSTKRQTFIFCGIAAILPAVRYEGLFAIAAVFLLLLWQRRAALAALMSVCALLPLAVFGLVSVHQGSLPFPNSVFLKVQSEAPNTLFDHFSTRILYWIVHLLEVRMFFIALALAIFARWTMRRNRNSPEINSENTRNGWLLALFLLMFGLHLQFARWGWLFRYEAYLIVSGGWILSLAARDFWIGEKEKMARSGARNLRPYLALPPALGLVFVGLNRGFDAWGATPPAMNHVHDQQIQMARFFRRYFRGQSVAANDIGAISYFGDVQLLDLYGIASRDVFEAKRAHRYTQNALTTIAEKYDVQVAALYPNWFVPGGQSGIPSGAGEILPRSWRRVGTWRLGEFGFGSDVAFYAANPRAQRQLIAALRDFASQLPRTQKQSGLYTRSEN